MTKFKGNRIWKLSELYEENELKHCFAVELEEKEMELEKLNRDNLATTIARLLFLMALLCLAEMAGIFSIVEVTHQREAQYMELLAQKQGEYQDLYYGYTSANLYRLIDAEEEFLLQQGLNTTSLKDKLVSMTYRSVDSFQVHYIAETLNSEAIEYELRFHRYTLRTDTSKTNLIDYSQNLATFTLNKSMLFLAHNYRTLASLDEQLEIESQESYLGISFPVLIRAILSLSIGLAFLLYLCVFKVLCKVEDRLEQVETLFDHLNRERLQLAKMTMQIKQFRTEFK